MSQQQLYGESYGATPAENYQRFFVPAIGAPVSDDLIAIAGRGGRRPATSSGLDDGDRTEVGAGDRNGTATILVRGGAPEDG